MDIEPLLVEPRFQILTPGPLAKFHGKSDPVYDIEVEQPWHRTAAFAFALGASLSDVATQHDKAVATVSNLLRQPWFQEKVSVIMAEYGGRDVIELFKAEQFNSLQTLISIRDDKKIAPTVRVTCARDILDRALGKPTQYIEQKTAISSDDPVAEVKRLEEENNRLSRN